MSSYRKERVADMLLGFLGQEIPRLNDHRFEFLTLTGIEMTTDLKIATVYWTVPELKNPNQNRAELDSEEVTVETFPEQKRLNDVGEALKSVEYSLKKKIAKALKLRYTPKLIFKYDDSLSTGAKIDQLLDKIGL